MTDPADGADDGGRDRPEVPSNDEERAAGDGDPTDPQSSADRPVDEVPSRMDDIRERMTEIRDHLDERWETDPDATADDADPRDLVERLQKWETSDDASGNDGSAERPDRESADEE
jgi:hypothetical protein